MPMTSVAPDENDAVSISFHPCSSIAFAGLLCPMLRGEETKLEVGDVHAVWNLDLMHCAFVVFNVKDEGPMSFDGEAFSIPCTDWPASRTRSSNWSVRVAIVTEAKESTPMRNESVSKRIDGRLEYPLSD